MHYPVIKKTYYEKLVEILFNKVPEFRIISDYTVEKNSCVYPVLGELSLFISNNQKNKILMNTIASFLDEALKVKEFRVQEAICLQIFQSLNKINFHPLINQLSSESLKIYSEFNFKKQNV